MLSVEWGFMSLVVSESRPLNTVGTGSHPTVVLSRCALPCSRANRRQCESHRAFRDTSGLSDQAPRSASAFDSIINLSGLARTSISDYLPPPKSSPRWRGLLSGLTLRFDNVYKEECLPASLAECCLAHLDGSAECLTWAIR